MSDTELFPDIGEADVVGAPGPVTDSRQLPACTADDEAGFVQGVNTEAHPDNVSDDLPDEVAPPPDDDADAELPGDDELAALVADVSVDEVDGIGFDAADQQAEIDDPQGAAISPDAAITPGT